MMGNAAILYGLGKEYEALYWKYEVIREICQANGDFRKCLEL